MDGGHEQLSADAEREIRRLYTLYARLLDEGAGEAFAECFTRDGRLTSGSGAELSGREALGDFATGFHARETQTGSQPRHMVSGVLLECHGGGVSGSCYSILIRTAPGGPPQLSMVALYEDELVRAEGRWRFRVRTVSLDGRV